MNSWRTRSVWGALAICLVVVVGALVWIYIEARQLERRQVEGWIAADRGERVRLALWRMDSALAPLVTQEVARPYFEFAAFYPTQRAYSRMFAAIEEGEVLVPSPLLSYESSLVHLHFQVDAAGLITSPQVPSGNMLDLAEHQFVSGERLATCREKLAALREIVDPRGLFAALPPSPVGAVGADPSSAPAASVEANSRRAMQQRNYGNVWLSNTRGQVYRAQEAEDMQSVLGVNEQRMRQLNCEPTNLLPGDKTFPDPQQVPPRAQPGAVQAIWVAEELLLARHVRVDGQAYVQGCWLDREALEAQLLAGVRDLLPEAKLEAVSPAAATEDEMLLAALPIQLLPGEVESTIAAPESPIRYYLGSLWIGMFVAAGALVSLVCGVLTLTARRRDFVSAVTHEMRTPLTTFRMYTEMLAEGMVRDEDKQRSYLEKLRREADRLGHLVENVLAFAKLEDGRARRHLERVPLRSLFERVEDRLAERATQSAKCLEVDVVDSCERVQLVIDISAVEQILLNLIDNACKYAADAEDDRIVLSADCDERSVRLRVRDFGPGISSAGQRKLFRPFSKSVDEAALSAPGVGLGLSLSRRFAREMGGELELDRTVRPGACFLLTLPRAHVEAGE